MTARSKYVIPVEVLIPVWPDDDRAQGDELDLVRDALHDAALEIDLDGVLVVVQEPQYRGRE